MNRTPWLLPAAAMLSAAGVVLARRRWRPAGLWWALATTGYAATLGLVAAGPTIRYQHYLPPGQWLGAAPLSLLVLAVELAAVVIGLVRSRWRIGQLAGPWSRPALVLAGAAFVLTSATLSASPAVYGVELAVATAVQLLHLAAVGLGALALPAGTAERIDEVVRGWLGEEVPGPTRPRIDRFAILLGALAATLAALLAVFSYQLHPHVPDEVVYLIHARYFADGRLGLPVPDPYAGFDIDLMFRGGGRWYSPVPPGWPAVLAIGVKLGVPWLVNPLLNGVNVVLASLLLQQIYDRRTARLGTLLFALSPWNLFLAMSLLTHSATLLFALIAALGVARFRRRGGLPAMVLAGTGIGAVSLIRPLEGLALAGLLGLWSFGARPLGRMLAGGATLALVTAATAALVLPYNRALTGSARVFPIMAYTDALYGPGTNALGFGPNRGLGWSGLDPLPGHGPLDVLINANLNFFSLNVELFGWATGSLLVIALMIFGRPLRTGDRLMLAVVAVIVGIHSFYWFAGGPDFGPRYWYLIAVPAIALAARGSAALVGAGATPAARGRIAAGLAVLMAGSLLVFVPWRAADKYRGYRGMVPGIRTLARETPFGRSLVLVRGHRHPDYASAAIENPLDLDADQPIYGWDRDTTVARRLLERYRDRPVWLVDGPTVTGAGFRIVAGPVSADSLLRSTP